MRQLFYVQDLLRKDCHILKKKNALCDLYNMSEKDLEVPHDVIYSQKEAYKTIEDEDVTWCRSEILGILVDSGINHNTCRRE